MIPDIDGAYVVFPYDVRAEFDKYREKESVKNFCVRSKDLIINTHNVQQESNMHFQCRIMFLS